MQAVVFSLELVKTFFNMSKPVWVYDVTFLALFGAGKASLILPLNTNLIGSAIG